MFHVYVLISEKNDRMYVGSTEDVNRRLVRHNAGHSKSTRHGVPWKLVHFESFETRSEAIWKEKYYKTGKGREELKEILA